MSFILLAIQTSPLPGKLPCQVGITWISIVTDIAIGCSSTNLMIRTWVIWKDSRLVHALLLLIALGQWTILAIDVAYIKSSELDGACVVHDTNPALSALIFMYTVCYDLLVLVLSIVKLSKQPSNSPLKERLRTQGLSYFAVAALANSFPTIFALMGADALVAIAGNTAITVSTIASCRAVRSLLGLRLPCSCNTFYATEDNVVLTTRLPEQTLAMTTSIGTDQATSMGTVC